MVLPTSAAVGLCADELGTHGCALPDGGALASRRARVAGCQVPKRKVGRRARGPCGVCSGLETSPHASDGVFRPSGTLRDDSISQLLSSWSPLHRPARQPRCIRSCAVPEALLHTVPQQRRIDFSGSVAPRRCCAVSHSCSAAPRPSWRGRYASCDRSARRRRWSSRPPRRKSSGWAFPRSSPPLRACSSAWKSKFRGAS